MPRVLVIAIGNPLRSDDGLAWRAADELSNLLPSTDVEILKVHQLTPELAEDTSRADRAIFIDAAASGNPGTLTCEEVVASEGESGSSHHLTPSALLRMSAVLYDACPKTFLVSLAGKSFEHGDSLSPEVERSLPTLVLKICDLLLTST